MLNRILLQIYHFRFAIVLYVIVTIAFLIFISIIGKRFIWNKSKVLSYAFLYDMNKKTLISYCLYLGRMLFVFFLAVFPSLLGIESAAVFILITLIAGLISKEFKALPSQLLTYVCIFGLLLLESMFYSYYLQIEKYWLIKAMAIFLGSFTSLYALYHQIITHEKLVYASGYNALNVQSKDNTAKVLKQLLSKKEKGGSIIDV